MTPQRLSTLAGSLLMLAFGPALAQDTQVVAVSGVPAPDGNGTIVSFVDPPDDPAPSPGFGVVLNDAGQVALPGYLTGTAGGTTDGSGLFFTDGTTLVQLVRAGQTAPGAGGIVYYIDHTTMPALNGAGRVARSLLFVANPSGATFEHGGFTVDPMGEHPSVFLAEGDPSPDGDGIVQSVFNPVITDTGRLGFTCVFEDASDPIGTRGIVRGDALTGEIEVLAREDDVPPNGDGRYSLLYGVDLNDAGRLVFQASISSPTADDAAIYTVDEAQGTISKVVRVGDPSPDSDEVVERIKTEGRNPINEVGQIAYAVGFAECTNNCIATSAGIFRHDPDAEVPIARTGQPAPDNGIFVGFGVPGTNSVAPALNDLGQVAFFGLVARAGFVFNGIYRGDGQETIEIVNNGQQAPNGNGIFTLDSNGSQAFDSNDVPKMNERGQVAFFTNLRDTDAGILDNEGIFFYDDALGLMEVVRENDVLLGSRIRELRFTARGSNPHDNARSGLNNLGQVAFAFELNDGRSGAAIWTPPSSVATPELPQSTAATLAIDAVHPNPFRASTSLSFSLAAPTEVTLSVYDVGGRRLLRRHLGVLAAGAHRAELGDGPMAPGVYFARLTPAAGAARTARIVKAR